MLSCVIMKGMKKSLIETNPYLQDSDKYWKALITNVASSTAIETGDSTQSIAKRLAKSETHQRLSSIKKPKVSSQ